MKILDMFPAERRWAVFSTDRVYRYSLDIIWDESKPLVQFIGLNPSTADEIKDDNTVRKCKQFARQWGYGGIVMTNLFAFRSTDPKAMKHHPHPTEAENWLSDNGVSNDLALITVANRCGLSVAAWGNHGTHLNRSIGVVELFRDHAKALKCFRVTKSKQPEHPLYMPYTQPLIDFQ